MKLMFLLVNLLDILALLLPAAFPIFSAFNSVM